jgi:ribosome biogenesis GTPase
LRGLVIKSTGSSYIVRTDDGLDVECYIKGNFRIRGIRSTNPVAVGDYVQVEDGWITDVEDRRNYIIRKSTNLSKESHILAANIDQAVLLVTISHPYTNLTFIDRFLATCEAYRVPAILAFNKTDLLTEDEHLELFLDMEQYSDIGYQTLSISAKQMLTEQLAPEQRHPHNTLRKLLAGKTTLLSGNSGVGKSTLLNALLGHEIARTGEISDVHDMGKHTTTFSEMYFLPNGGAIIDTPGIKGFGAFDMEKEEVSHYFPEIFRIGRNCRFSNCLHTDEPGCAVQEAVEQRKIALSRYESYLSMLGDCDESKYR